MEGDEIQLILLKHKCNTNYRYKQLGGIEVQLANTEICSTLETLGFKGKLLKDMSVLVQTESDLEDLEAFILRNERKLTTSLSIVNEYRRKKLDSYPNKDVFIEFYEKSSTIEEKKRCLELLLNTHVEERWIINLDNKIQAGDITLVNFYNTFIENPSLHIKKLILEASIKEENLFW